MLGDSKLRIIQRMENLINSNEANAERNVLQAEYEYLLNRERRITQEKQVVLEKLLKLKEIIEKAKA